MAEMKILKHIRRSLLLGSVVAASLSSPHAGADPVADALANPARPSHELRLDPVRHPWAVLDFFGIEPGMTVVDLFAGEGYYTEILSHLVGENGHVTMYNHAPWEAYSKAGSDARVAGGRLVNVTTQFEDLNTLRFPQDHYDAAVAVLGMHDLYLKSEKSVAGDPIDPAHFVQALFAGVKPGGIVGIVEHEAKAGSDPHESAELHRLESGHIIRLMEAAGFVFEAQSSILRNNDDDLTRVVWAEGLRRHTDRAVLRFRKPEA